MKRTNKFLTVALSTLLLSVVACNKVSMQEAEQAYSDKKFTLAGEMYGKIASKQSKKQETKEEKLAKLKAYFMAAESYRNANDYKNAEKWYKKTIKKDKANTDAIWRYASILQKQNKYREALDQYTEYLKLEPGDDNARKRQEYCEKALAISEDSSRFTVTNFKIANTKMSDYSPMIASKKDNKLYFTSDRITTGPSKKKAFEWTGRGYSDLYQMEFTGKRNKQKWQRPEILEKGVNTKHNDGVCAFDRRFSTMYYTICNAPDPNKKKDVNLDCKIYMVRKQGQSWGDPEILPFCKDDTFTYGHPVLSPDGTKMYFSSDKPGGFGGHDIYVSSFVRKGRTWSEPVNLGETINTAGDEVFPYFNKHDNKLYFSSNGLPGLGGLDLFRTEGSGKEWEEPENLLKPMNSGGDDFGITFDNMKDNHGFFTSNREGGRGSDDIYEFDVQPLVFRLMGYVTDCNSSKPLTKATVHLSNDNDTSVLHLKTDENGYYQVELTAETAYDFFATDKPEHYFDSREYGVSTKGLEVSKDFVQDICLTNPFDEIKVYPIYYDLDKDFIRPDAAKILDELYTDVLQKYPYVTIELGSHTDCRASYAYNEDLSQRRAQSAVNYLIKKGCDPNRILAKGYGESELANECSCEPTNKSGLTPYRFMRNGKPMTAFKQVITTDANGNFVVDKKAYLPSEIIVQDGAEYVDCNDGDYQHSQNRRTTVKILSKNYDPKDPSTYANANQDFSMDLVKNGENYVVPTEVNGSDLLDFELVKGDVIFISSEGMKGLQTAGRVLKSDLKASEKVKLPSGETVNGRGLNIRNLKVGRTNLKNVKAYIVPTLSTEYMLGEGLIKQMGAKLDEATGKLKFESRLGNINDKTKIGENDDPNNTNLGSGNKDALKDGPLDGNKEAAEVKFVPDESWEALTVSGSGKNKKINSMVNGKQAMSWTYNPAARKTVITEDALKALMDAGAITKQDFLDGDKVKLSNGLKLRSNKFKINALTVGGYDVTSLTVEVSSKATENQLGRAFFRKFLPEIHEQDGKLYIKPKRRPKKK